MRLPKALAACVVVLLLASVAAAAQTGATHHRRPAAARYALASVGGYALGDTPPAAAPTVLQVAPGPLGATTQPPGATTQPPVAPVAAQRTSAPTPARPVALPVPSLPTLPAVARLGTLRSADAVVMVRNSLRTPQAAQVARLPGLSAVEEVDTGTVQLAGAPVVTFGVDPGTFRAFTPSASAASNQLWQYLAAGSLVSSYEMATDRRLKLGAEEPITTAGQTSPLKGWIGAFASIGLPGVDLLVDHRYSSDLGLAPNTGLVVSAPGMAGQQLLSELKRALPGAAVELLHPDQVTGLVAGNGLDGGLRSAIISAALSRVGTPYVWGATGPGSFDCSGLVKWSFAQAGILMPRTAAEQFLTGIRIPLASAQPGDLLFWTYDPNDPGFVDHTAIYLGNGMMVVAPHTGVDVQVAPVPTNDFAGAVRVLLQ